MLVLVILALASMSALAVDGVVLINQSTVMAAGGFPYKITQPGSYKLSGNLAAPINVDVIHISADNVTLDLAGFNVQCSVQPVAGTIRTVRCITGDGGHHNLSISNGTITATAKAGADNQYDLSPVAFFETDRMTLENVRTEDLDPTFSPLSFNLGIEVVLPAHSLIRHNTFFSGATVEAPPNLAIDCPSVVVENVTVNFRFDALLPTSCVVSNNVGIRN